MVYQQITIVKGALFIAMKNGKLGDVCEDIWHVPMRGDQGAAASCLEGCLDRPKSLFLGLAPRISIHLKQGSIQMLSISMSADSTDISNQEKNMQSAASNQQMPDASHQLVAISH